MRTLAVLVILALSIGPALAEPAPPPKTAPAAPATCKRTVIGKGLERHTVCVFEAPVVVSAAAPKPEVIIVHQDPRSVVGRPRASDRFAGLSHQLR